MNMIEPIDWITMQKSVADLADGQRRQKMQAEKNANSDDKILIAHRDYWLKLAARHGEMARILDDIWQQHLQGPQP
jgi:hypothetical protein